MRLPIFLLGFAVAVVAATAIGMAAGFETGTLVAFVIAVVIVAQLAYVGLIALLAVERKRQMPDASTPKARTSRVSRENDA